MKSRIVVVMLGILASAGVAFSAVVFDQNFDDTNVFTTAIADGSYVGSDTTTAGRWGAFDTSSGTQYSISTNEAYSGAQSLMLTRTAFESGDHIAVRRNGASFADPVGGGASSQDKFSVSFQIYMVDDASNNPGTTLLQWGSTDGTWTTSAGMGVKENGRLIQNISGSWVEIGTDAAVSPNEWTEVRWDYDLTAGSAGQVMAYVDGTAVKSTATDLTAFVDASDRLQFLASTENNQINYVDDFHLIPEPASLGLMGLSALALWFVRRKLR
jgi:hypothetical protein